MPASNSKSDDSAFVRRVRRSHRKRSNRHTRGGCDIDGAIIIRSPNCNNVQRATRSCQYEIIIRRGDISQPKGTGLVDEDTLSHHSVCRDEGEHRGIKKGSCDEITLDLSGTRDQKLYRLLFIVRELELLSAGLTRVPLRLGG